MNKKKLLFSKVEKSDKSTSMGEQNENIREKLGIPKTENKEINTQKSNGGTENGLNKEEKTNEKKIQKATDGSIKGTPAKNNLKELEEETIKLKNDLKKAEEEYNTEHENLMKEKDKIYKTLKQINVEMRVLSNDFKKKIEKLKELEKNIVIPDKKKFKNNGKTEEQFEKDIKMLNEEIKIIKKNNQFYVDNCNENIKNFEKKEIKNNKNKEEFKKISDQLSKLYAMKRIENEHKQCEENLRLLREEYNEFNEKYQKQLKIKEAYENAEKKNDMDIPDERTNKDEQEQEDNKGRAIEDEKKFLPKIQNLKFNTDSANRLEALDAKIARLNRIGKKNINSINLFNKVNKEILDNERYKIELEKEKAKEKIIGKSKEKEEAETDREREREDNKKKFLNKNRNKSNVALKKNYLFTEHEQNVLQKLLPKEMLNSYRNKYNNILEKQKEIQKIMKTESADIENAKYTLINNKDFKDMKIIELKRKNTVLRNQYNKIRDKVRKIKKQIQQIENYIQKEEKKIRSKNQEAMRIRIYCKGIKYFREQQKKEQQKKENQNGHENVEENEESQKITIFKKLYLI